MCEEDEYWESGPFCRHWGDPSDCDERCATCGHLCRWHSYGDGKTDCFEDEDDDDCECTEWVESE